MFSYDLSRDQHRLRARIGIEAPMSEFTKNFFIPGQAHLKHPTISIAPEYKALPVPYIATLGSTVPVICMRNGSAQFGVAKWGAENQSLGTTDYFKECERGAVGLPGLIPASFIDYDVDAEKSDTNYSGVRLRAASGGNLFIACTYRYGEFGNAGFVMPLVCEPGEDIAPYIDWQIVLISMCPTPTASNFDFITRVNHKHLQTPSSHRSLKVEPLIKSARLDERRGKQALALT